MPDETPTCKRCGGPKVTKKTINGLHYLGCADPKCVASRPITHAADRRKGARLPERKDDPPALKDPPKKDDPQQKKKGFLSNLADEWL